MIQVLPYVVVPHDNALTRRTFLGLSPICRMLHELKQAGFAGVTLLTRDGESPGRAALRNAPSEMELVFAPAPQFESLEQLAVSLAKPGALVVDAACIFARGTLGGLLAEPAVPGGPLALTLASGTAAALVRGSQGSEPGPGRSRDLAGSCVRLAGPSDLEEAKWLLLNGLRKPMLVDGIVGYFFMRPITLRITSVLANTPVTPNQVTAVCFLLGMAGAGLVAFGNSFGLMVLGLLLYFLGATLDCVDGELSRLKYKASLLGAWFDTASDDVSTFLLVAAMGMYLSHTMGSEFFLVFGFAGALCFMVAQLYVYYHLLTRFHSGDVLDFVWAFQDEKVDKSQRSGPSDYALLLTKRDFFSAFLLACGATGLLVVGATIVSGVCICYIGIVAYDAVVAGRR